MAGRLQSGSGGATVGGFVAFVMAMLQLVAPIKHLSEVAGPITRGIATPHETMPSFRPTEEELDAIVAYINSLPSAR